MQAKILNEGPERTCALVLQAGEEVVSALEGFAQEHGLAATRITAIGALQQAVLGHLLSGRVRPTLEVLMVDSPSYLARRHDPESGLALIRMEAGPGSLPDPSAGSLARPAACLWLPLPAPSLGARAQGRPGLRYPANAGGPFSAKRVASR